MNQNKVRKGNKNIKRRCAHRYIRRRWYGKNNIKTVTAVQYSTVQCNAVQCSAIQYIKTIERNEQKQRKEM